MSTESPDLSALDYLEPILAETGLALETNPAEWERLWRIPALRAIAYIDVPAPFNPYPFSSVGIGHDICPYHLQLALIEYLSRFDASCLMALPGSSLCTRVMLALGTDAQIDRFFERFRSDGGPQWAFFAITEHEVGSDATTVRARVSFIDNQRYLNAVKMLIGAVEHASVGLVFAHVGDRQELCLVMVEPSLQPDKVTYERLPVFGLTGAGLCRLVIRDLPIGAEQMLGGERRSLRDGLSGIVSVFERHRPMVGAMALGTGRGLVNALERAGVPAHALALYKLEHAALYRRMHRVAASYEQARLRGHEASLFKLQATQFVQRVAQAVPRLLPCKTLLSSASLRKKYRDAFAFEYMEGTSNIQTLNAYRSYVASRGNDDIAS
jgi:diaminopimelate decarboxylase